MANKTKNDYENYLNNIGCSFENCEYITNPSRGKHLKAQSLRNALNNFEYGKVLRKYDPIAFETGYNEWK